MSLLIRTFSVQRSQNNRIFLFCLIILLVKCTKSSDCAGCCSKDRWWTEPSGKHWWISARRSPTWCITKTSDFLCIHNRLKLRPPVPSLLRLVWGSTVGGHKQGGTRRFWSCDPGFWKHRDQSVVMIPKPLECVKDECKYPKWKQLIFLFASF